MEYISACVDRLKYITVLLTIQHHEIYSIFRCLTLHFLFIFVVLKILHFKRLYFSVITKSTFSFSK